MSSFAFRMDGASNHEQNVRDLLINHGWYVDPFGQAQLSENMRVSLQRIDTSLRWLPDFIATKSHRVVLVDAKSGRTDTRHFDIECRSLESHAALEQLWLVPVFYVFADFTVGWPQIVKQHCTPGPRTHRGSGTPYVLVRRAVMKPFETVFGGTDARTLAFAMARALRDGVAA